MPSEHSPQLSMSADQIFTPGPDFITRRPIAKRTIHHREKQMFQRDFFGN